jgi:hypothetical protein
MPFASVKRFVYLQVSDPTAAAAQRNCKAAADFVI